MNDSVKILISSSLFLIGLLLLPFGLTNDYYLNVCIIACLNALIVVGLNLLIGFAGQVSLGHAAFFGLAAYTSAIVTTTLHWPVFLGLPAALVIVFLAALAIGIPALKLQGHYLAMATLGFGIIVHIILNETTGLTHGPSGFVGIPPLSAFGYIITSDRTYYYLVAIVLSLAVFFAQNLVHSRFGRALLAIHVSEKAAQMAGINIARFKLMIFIFSALLAGVAGFLYAHHLKFVAPSSFGFNHSVLFIAMVVLGGMTHIFGAILGAFFLSLLPEFLRSFEQTEYLVYGTLLIFCMMYLPDGLAGGCIRLWDTFLSKKVEHGSK